MLFVKLDAQWIKLLADLAAKTLSCMKEGLKQLLLAIRELKMADTGFPNIIALLRLQKLPGQDIESGLDIIYSHFSNWHCILQKRLNVPLQGLHVPE